jgi:hypothetical protein
MIYYFESSWTWNFDMSAPYDSSSAFATLDVKDLTSSYIENGVVIKVDHLQQTVYNSTGHDEIDEDSSYYFDGSGEKVTELEKEMLQWIKFAKSKKSYAEFFGKQ